jgi:PRTRC genetic system protein B
MPNAQFQLNLREAGTMQLAQAVLIYRPTCAGTDHAYASVHDIALTDGGPIIRAGKPITPRAALRIAHALSSNTGHSGYLPGNVLYADADKLVWWVPPHRRHMAFRCPDAALGDQSAVVPHPALVFMVSGTRWMVWAHKGRARPVPESLMWQAPYFNVGGDGAICRGNVATPTGTTADRIGAWEDAFFRSYFSHPNLPKGLVRHPKGAYAFWAEMMDGQFARFPQRALVPTGARLGELVERHVRGTT